MNCPTCGQTTDSDLALAVRVDKLADWDDLYYCGKGYTQEFDGLGDVEIVVDVPSSTHDSYGGVVEEDIFIVVKVQDRLFKKEGYRNSYGTVEFDGECREVKAEPKTVTVFDYV